MSTLVIRLDSERAIAAACRAEGAEFVHWFRVGAPLGDQAQCGATQGRATRLASAVTCPNCIRWMSDEAWTGHSGTGAA